MLNKEDMDGDYGRFESEEKLMRTQTDATNLTTTRGLLELMHIPSDTSLPYTHSNDYASSPPAVGFSHLGITVPDVQVALDRAMEYGGSKVIKRVGEVLFEDGAMIAGKEVDSAIREGKAIEEGGCAQWCLGMMRGFAFVADPDVSSRGSLMRVFFLGLWSEGSVEMILIISV
jgi:hypothetical protein